MDASTPNCLRHGRSGSMGLRSKDFPSKNTVGAVARAATGIINRNVAPDSPQSIGFSEPLNGDAPSTVQQSLDTCTFAPKASTARSVASVSSEVNLPEILEIPAESEAAISILCVYAFEGGAQTSPLSL